MKQKTETPHTKVSTLKPPKIGKKVENVNEKQPKNKTYGSNKKEML